MSKARDQEVVTKWICRRGYRGDFILKSWEFRVTTKMFIMLRPEEQSCDTKTAFEYSTRFDHCDPRLSDSAEQAIIKLETVQRGQISMLDGKIAKSRRIITEVNQFLARWKSANP